MVLEGLWVYVELAGSGLLRKEANARRWSFVVRLSLEVWGLLEVWMINLLIVLGYSSLIGTFISNGALSRGGTCSMRTISWAIVLGAFNNRIVLGDQSGLTVHLRHELISSVSLDILRIERRWYEFLCRGLINWLDSWELLVRAIEVSWSLLLEIWDLT